jgi:tetratricopeptide (TPR) repeat protein
MMRNLPISILEPIKNAVESGDIKRALTLLEKVDATSHTVEICQLKGTLHTMCNNFSQAKLELQKGLALLPTSPDIATGLAEVYLKMGHAKEAKQRLTDIVIQHPAFSRAHFQLGLMAFNDENFKDAITHLEASSSVPNPHPSALTVLARTYLDLKDYKKAGPLFVKALKNNPNDIEAHCFLAELYIVIGEGVKSVKHYEKILEIAPTHAEAIRLCGIAYLHQGKYKEALVLLEKTLAFEPSNNQYQFRYASCLTSLGHHDKAIKVYTNLEKNNPKNQLVMCSKGMSQLLKEDYSTAIKTFKNAVQIDPKNSTPYQYIGILFMKMKKLDKAANAFSKAIALEPNIAELHCLLGTCLLELKQNKEAIIAFSKAVELSPLEGYQTLLAKAIG